VLYGREEKTRWDVRFDKKVAEDDIKGIIRAKDNSKVCAKRVKKGALRVWVELIKGRPDQTKDYIFGIDISKGQGASNSVVSIKCEQTNEKIAEWRDANTPPYEMAPIIMALAIWCGGRSRLPFLKWEMNGPGWDFGRKVVKSYNYPYYYKNIKPGKTRDSASKTYGWFSSPNSKFELLTEYDRALVHGGIINHSIWGLEEAKRYVYYDGGGVGPADLVEESSSAKKTHGDIVIADALTITRSSVKHNKKVDVKCPATTRCAGYRKQLLREKRRRISVGSGFDFRGK
jgi:hypothetical protein